MLAFMGVRKWEGWDLGEEEQVEELWNWLAQGGCFDSFHNVRIDFVIAVVGFAALK